MEGGGKRKGKGICFLGGGGDGEENNGGQLVPSRGGNGGSGGNDGRGGKGVKNSRLRAAIPPSMDANVKATKRNKMKNLLEDILIRYPRKQLTSFGF